MATGTLVARRPPFNPSRLVRRVLFYAVVVLVCAIVMFPVYWMIVSAIQPARLSMHWPPPFIPQAISLTPLEQLFRDYPVITWVTNSTIISLLSTVLCLVLGIFGAYTLSCLRWKGRAGNALFFWNVEPDGRPDRRTAHAGLPPTRGEKWLLSQWIRGPALQVQ